ncbi:hypothetical protein HII36_31375 [Nonomuraea sp. NN258]|uniref:suppressor of fused domain protein n=1 Tax=Nonomuraea antri TaxID=2730852 RepID=UPI001568CB4F|nr:suppressor of fused domain protein [Nonomuraea antri]NRQ36302.1 hypothetical protein [Nonomuraea antri]
MLALLICLDHGHVVPIGRSRGLRMGGGHARILWLLPITPAERDLIMSAGLEAFESLMEEKQVDYSDPHRLSVV